MTTKRLPKRKTRRVAMRRRGRTFSKPTHGSSALVSEIGLYTTWDEEKLEQTVRGANLHTSGKRADAFLVSNGLLRSVALAEIKHPDTPLLTRDQYRSDVYGISREFFGAVAQAKKRF